MSDPYIGEIRLFPYQYAPYGWAECDGTILNIQQNTALFSVIGNVYGGDGKTTFALPDLRGRVPVHSSAGDNARIEIARAEKKGEENHTLSLSETPSHSHAPGASNVAGTSSTTTGNVWAKAAAGHNFYALATAGNMAAMNPACVEAASGGGQPHSNMQPFLALRYCIAVMGIFPVRS